jgi:acetyl-CoA/propionyl-CoA carboxylase biotin carboxyl carrier protein
VRFDVVGPDGGRLLLTLHGDLAASEVGIGDRTVSASAVPTADGLLLTLDGTTHHVGVRDGWIGLDGAAWHVVEAPPPRTKADAAAADGEVRSPMPGSVVDRPAEPGTEVDAGAPLLVLEAMKMEHVLRAPLAGTVEILVRVGDQVAVDQVLARVQPATAVPAGDDERATEEN